ncbi:MAG: hypothetical protein NTX52_05250 [Planctomycetota bacterium]|nr:hypothetical protein [Planctomycetota bacterium]
MAMSSRHSVAPVAASKYPYPSRFGSHKSMVVREEGEDLVQGQLVCKDEFGEYVTLRTRLDSGLADPARYNESRLEKLSTGQVE